MGAARFQEYCECGGGITLTGMNDELNEQVLNFWRVAHSGEGHRERISQEEATKIRERDRWKRRHAERGRDRVER